MEPIYKSLHSQLYKYIIYIIIYVSLSFVFLSLWVAFLMVTIGFFLLVILVYGSEINIVIYKDKITFDKISSFGVEQKKIEFDKETFFSFLMTEKVTQLVIETLRDKRTFGLGHINDEQSELGFLIHALLEEGYQVKLQYGVLYKPYIKEILIKYNLEIDNMSNQLKLTSRK